jgi:hypothetical protein
MKAYTGLHWFVFIGNGGAVLSAGELKVRSCNLTKNSGLSGGAVYTDNRATIDMKNCVLTENTAQQSGLLFVCSTIRSTGDMRIVVA